MAPLSEGERFIDSLLYDQRQRRHLLNVRYTNGLLSPSVP